jgi:hypothetical protein
MWGRIMLMDDYEPDTMKELLTMALNAVIAESLNINVDRVHPGSRLVSHLGMSSAAKRRLQKEIAFIFDCTEIDMPNAMKVEELVDQVAHIEFSRREQTLSVQACLIYKIGSGPMPDNSSQPGTHALGCVQYKQIQPIVDFFDQLSDPMSN